MPKLIDFLGEFSEALAAECYTDENWCIDGWIEWTNERSEQRFMDRIGAYFDGYVQGETTLPWLKIAGLALACWVRGKHPWISSHSEGVESSW